MASRTLPGEFIARRFAEVFDRRRLDAQVLGEVVQERARQDERWGQQNHPDVSPATAGWSPEAVASFHLLPAATLAKNVVDVAAEMGTDSWAGILTEELAEYVEAAALGDTAAARAELVQLAAVAVAAVQAIDRRPPEDDDDLRECASCGDEVLTLSSRDWCDGCEASPPPPPVTPRDVEHHPHEDVHEVRAMLDQEPGS